MRLERVTKGRSGRVRGGSGSSGRRRRAVSFVLRWILALGSGAAGLSSCSDLPHDFVDEGAEAWRVRVLEEIAAGAAPAWAGSYRWANGYEHHALDLGPSAFSYRYAHCTGPGLVAYGTVEVVGEERVRIDVTRSFRGRDSERAVLPPSGGELVSVPWGSQRFLVAVERMPEFCAAAAEPGGIQYETYLRLVEGERLEARFPPEPEGAPSLPAEFRHLLPGEAGVDLGEGR